MRTHSVSKQGAATLAGGLGLALASGAQAGIVYTDIPDIVSTYAPGEDGSRTYNFDIDNDLTDDFAITHSQRTDYWGYDEAVATIDGVSTNARTAYDGWTYSGGANVWYDAEAFDSGDEIGPASDFEDETKLGFVTSYDGGVDWAYGNFPGAGDKFVGLQFEIGGDLKYGWLRVNLSDTAQRLTIYDYAYQDSGRSIAAGAVPEPGSLALMATGALAISAFRRRRRKQLAA